MFRSTSRIFTRSVSNVKSSSLIPNVTRRTFYAPRVPSSTKKQELVFTIDANQYKDYQNTESSNNYFLWGVVGALAITPLCSSVWEARSKAPPYDKIRKEIEDILEDEKYDDGSYGPVFIRLAWHASGTYSTFEKNGGSDGATIRHSPEKDHGANAGLEVARNRLESIKKKHPEISYADLYVLASIVAIEEMGGPSIRFFPGRTDTADNSKCTPDGRLPDAARNADHIRAIFYRMGLNDEEIVALVGGGHAIGRCHTDRSGFTGPWTNSPTMFTNDFFVQLLNNKWTEKKWDGPKQYEDPTGELMMLPTDLELRDDPDFRKYSEKFAEDEEYFFKVFAAAYEKLTSLGCTRLCPVAV